MQNISEEISLRSCEMDLREIFCEDVKFTELAQNRDNQRALA